MQTREDETDVVVAALADPTRRRLLDALRVEDGRTIGSLTEAVAPLGRHVVLKHVRILEAAGLVATRKVGRERRCHLDAVPIVRLAERWIDDFGARVGAGLSQLKTELEGEAPRREDRT
jgi:DNA-binding transcriptional ArsR family regulator